MSPLPGSGTTARSRSNPRSSPARLAPRPGSHRRAPKRPFSSVRTPSTAAAHHTRARLTRPVISPAPGRRVHYGQSPVIASGRRRGELPGAPVQGGSRHAHVNGHLGRRLSALDQPEGASGSGCPCRSDAARSGPCRRPDVCERSDTCRSASCWRVDTLAYPTGFPKSTPSVSQLRSSVRFPGHR